MKISVQFCALILLSTLITTAAQAHTGGSGLGNAGYVVKVNGKYRLLDLIEAGATPVAKSPKPAHAPKISEVRVMKHIPASLALTATEKAGVSDLVDYVASVDPILAVAMDHSFSAYIWTFVDAPLQNPNQSGSPVGIPESDWTPVAVRAGMTIRIDRAIFRSLPCADRIWLIAHEALFPYIRVQAQSDGFSEQPNEDVRGVIGILYRGLITPGSESDTVARLYGLQKNGLPVLSLYDAVSRGARSGVGGIGGGLTAGGRAMVSQSPFAAPIYPIGSGETWIAYSPVIVWAIESAPATLDVSNPSTIRSAMTEDLGTWEIQDPFTSPGSPIACEELTKDLRPVGGEDPIGIIYAPAFKLLLKNYSRDADDTEYAIVTEIVPSGFQSATGVDVEGANYGSLPLQSPATCAKVINPLRQTLIEVFRLSSGLQPLP